MTRIFGTDGIRGRAGEGWLAPAQVERIGGAVGGLLARRPALFGAAGRGRTVLIGRDTRASGPEIQEALERGLASAGVRVLQAGVLPTPGVARLARAWRCALGAVISASHNPAGDNGIKFFSPRGLKIPDAAERAIERFLTGSRVPPKARRAPPSAAKDPAPDYLDFLAGFCRRLKGLRIVADCAHGAASAFAGPLFRRLGARAVLLHASPDGRNINDGCGALHPAAVARAVRRERADLGVAFDGDADRAILVDEKGEVRDGDHVLALCGPVFREKGRLPRDLIVSTVMANFGLERYLADRGIALRRAAVGDRYVAEEMLRTGAALGGEPSGHMLFFDASPAGDGMLTTLRVLDLMAERGEPLSRLMGGLVKCPQVLLNVPVSRKPALESVPLFRRASDAARRALGDGGRLLVRYSGTEPLCRVMVEGTDAALVGRLARRLAGAVREALA